MLSEKPENLSSIVSKLNEKQKPLLCKLSSKKSQLYPKSLVDDQGNLKTTKLSGTASMNALS